MIFKLLYLRYYFFLKKFSPSALGVEEAASSSLIGFLASMNIIMAYLFVCKYIIRSYFFNEYVFFIGHFSVMFFCYFHFKNFHKKQFKNNKVLKEKALSITYTMLGIIYPVISLLSMYLLFNSLIKGRFILN
jgi:hypothetical protein